MVDGLIGQVRFDNYSGYDGTYTAAMDYGVLLTFSNIGGYSIQLMYSMGTGTRKYRMANMVTWLEWKNF